jgi:two-component system sensor kinase FixL
LRNAVDAMAGSTRREILVISQLQPDDMVEVSIADTGSGIDPEIAQHLFQPFVTNKRQGMGVGLSISRTIIDSHGGRIWAESNSGGGTIFRFTLPAVVEEEPAGVE